MSKTVKMKGLTNFIQEIRDCTSKEQEEARVAKELGNIRAKFKAEKGVSAYDLKKYTWKLMYIHMLGYPIEFGHMQALELMSAPAYGDKQVGYMALSLMLAEDHEFSRMCINSIKSDLLSNNEASMCLALAFAANLGSAEYAEALMPDLERIATQSSQRPVIRKKAALTLAKFARRAPDAVNLDLWRRALPVALETRDLGILLTLATLLQVILEHHGPSGFEPCAARLLDTLRRMVVRPEEDNAPGVAVTRDYTYYGIPSPWLQVKCLRCLQYFDLTTSIDLGSLSQLLHQLLGASASNTSTWPPGKVNALFAVLLEAASLAVLAEAGGGPLSLATSSMLGRMVEGSDANLKYLGLEYLGKMASIPGMQAALAGMESFLLGSLADEDTSIRRRVVDLLFLVCTDRNANALVKELLAFLGHAEVAVKEDVALKAAVLAEKFAPDNKWYVDTLLTLLREGGEYVGPDIWQRAVQVVTNDAALRPYAAERSLAELEEGGVLSDYFVRLAGYLLGEYARVTALEAERVRRVLMQRFHLASPETQAVLLSAITKICVFPGKAGTSPATQAEVRGLLQRLSHTAHPELQQRAVEYLKLLSDPSGQRAQTVLATMPRFPPRESFLLRRVAARGAPSPADADAAAQGLSALSVSLPTQEGDMLGMAPSTSTSASNARPAPSAPADGIDARLGPSQPSQPPRAVNSHPALPSSNGGPPRGPPDAPAASAPSPDGLVRNEASLRGWPPGLRKLCVGDSGVLYEDACLQVGMKAQVVGAVGRLMLYLGNKSGVALTQLSVSIHPVPPGYRAQLLDQAPPALSPGQQLPLKAAVAARAPSLPLPTLRIAFLGPQGPVQCAVPLPAVPPRFAQPAPGLSREAFFAAWRAFPHRAQRSGQAAAPLPPDRVDAALSLARLHPTPLIDPSPDNAVGAATLPFEAAGEVRVLARVEVEPGARQRFRVTVAAGGGAGVDGAPVAEWTAAVVAGVLEG